MGHSYAIQDTPFAAYSQQSFPESIIPASLFAKEPPTQFLSASQSLQPARSWSYRKTPVLVITILLACAISIVCFSAARVETEVAVSRHSALLQTQHPRDMESAHQGNVIKCHLLHSVDTMQHSSTDTAVCSEELDALELPQQQHLQQVTLWQQSQGSSSSRSYVSSLIGTSLGRRFSHRRRRLRLVAAS